jgi:hypothetical protein
MKNEYVVIDIKITKTICEPDEKSPGNNLSKQSTITHLMIEGEKTTKPIEELIDIVRKIDKETNDTRTE